ncbi:PTS fructose transporter subunit EIIC [Alkalibacter saccharofermentans]|uniref:PTS system, fructose-specific IIC-like component n=1 Tax=Alkalibacter saccharofermentans DSM 14828 TaxID=1120975 RepID=A0A1M4UXL5_9FIRM|nr:PTS fructose transporter subunit EIIC [Alkalibacter saccharofermentans]SHE61415.1 PTS system, fructose-specific IIC-like component [Alkalibacter saccharofermentans DSM 14828]
MNELMEILKDTRKHLMTGVSHMIPIVVAGGVLIALSVAMSGSPSVPDEGTFLKGIFDIGAAGFALMVPFLAAYIAYSIADRPGLAPGAIGGFLCNSIGAGFLGGLIVGIIAGIIAHLLKKIQVPTTLKPVMPIFVIPLVTTLLVGSLVMWGIGAPIASMMEGLTNWLVALNTGNKILLGAIIGAMCAFDMGGPVGKVAYTFGVGLLGSGVTTVMGAVGVGVCIPPLGMALATFLAPKKYTMGERENGKAALIMGTIAISEGAIPFAAMDPLRVIPSMMIGGSVGSALAMMFGATNAAPWGGLIVLPVIGNPIGYLVSVVVGVVITAFTVNALKTVVAEDADEDLEMEMLS